jgi:hypothetical protein
MKVWKLITIAVVGGFLSIALHETFHVLMHLGHIQRLQLFPGNGNVFQVVATTPAGYNVMHEELIAYSITAIVLIATMYLFIREGVKK